MRSTLIGAFLRLAIFTIALFGAPVHAEEKIMVILLHGKNAPKPIANFEQLYYSAKRRATLSKRSIKSTDDGAAACIERDSGTQRAGRDRQPSSKAACRAADHPASLGH
jgi:hypothetical protein